MHTCNEWTCIEVYVWMSLCVRARACVCTHVRVSCTLYDCVQGIVCVVVYVRVYVLCHHVRWMMLEI